MGTLVPMGTPHPALRTLVTAYVGYDLHLDPRALHFGLPSTTATVILAFDEPLDVGWADAPETRSAIWALASGLHHRPSLIRTHGRQHGIQLALTPAGARRLLGVPIAAVTGELAHHDDLPLGVDAGMHERLASTDRWPQRYALLDRHLLGLLNDQSPRRPVADEVAEAWRVVCRRHGDVRIDRLADHVGWSRRRLSEAFRGEFGLTPKRAAQVARFEYALRLARSGRELGEVAVTAGYADQPHLVREWRSHAGRSPTRTLADDFPILQD